MHEEYTSTYIYIGTDVLATHVEYFNDFSIVPASRLFFEKYEYRLYSILKYIYNIHTYTWNLINFFLISPEGIEIIYYFEID